MTVLDRAYEQPMREEELATDLLAGGMMLGYQCGMLWGSSLAVGARAFRLYGAGPAAEAAALRASRRLVDAFRFRHGHVDCMEITETDPRDGWATFVHFFIKGGAFRCAARMASFAPEAFSEAEAALAPPDPVVPWPRCSCAAEVARQMGASDQHAVMAAGLAGGIGLSGSGCGALGAAIWLLSMAARDQGLSGKAIQQRVDALKERFLEFSGHEYACADIVGRRFEGLVDHSSHLHRGGCAGLIQEVAREAEGLI